MNHTINLIADILLFGLPFPLLAFIVFYLSFSNWRSTLVGKILISQKWAELALVLFLDLQVIFARIAGETKIEDYTGQSLLRLMIYLSLTIVFWWIFYALRKEQKK